MWTVSSQQNSLVASKWTFCLFCRVFVLYERRLINGPFTSETNWNSSWIEWTNCHTFQFVCSTRDECQFISGEDGPMWSCLVVNVRFAVGIRIAGGICQANCIAQLRGVQFVVWCLAAPACYIKRESLCFRWFLMPYSRGCEFAKSFRSNKIAT